MSGQIKFIIFGEPVAQDRPKFNTIRRNVRAIGVEITLKRLIEKLFKKVIGKYSESQNESNSVKIPKDYEEIFEGDSQNVLHN